MKAFWLTAALVALAGCSSMDMSVHRTEPRAFGNPALLNCAANRARVCRVDGGRTRKHYSNCACRAVSAGRT